MSTKYNFGYNLEIGSTNEWAYNCVIERTKVLELGSSVGNLTKHLKENKACCVDIVEIDEEAGNMAAQYANIALLGYDNGNLNTDIWYKKLEGNKYDYVIILDVLEHLDNPRFCLKLVKKLLKPNGQIITSIPNVANNAIIVNLINDKFQYTNLGLLDNTHRFFFTYNTIVQIFEEVGYGICSVDAIIKPVGASEVVAGYEDVPEEIGIYLKSRQLGDVYQYLIIATQEPQNTEFLIDSEYKKNEVKSLILFNGLSEGMLTFKKNVENVDIEFEIKKEQNIESIRFVPMEHDCYVSDLKAEVYLEDRWYEISPNWTTGIELDINCYLLLENKHEINWNLESQVLRMRIRCKIIPIYATMKSTFEDICKKVEVKNSKYYELESKVDNLNRNVMNLNQIIEDKNQIIEDKEKLINEKNNLIEDKNRELYDIKSTLIFRIFNKLGLLGNR